MSDRKDKDLFNTQIKISILKKLPFDIDSFTNI